MKENKVISYFDSLGKLFYAVAAVDKKIPSEEIQTLNQLIEEYWTDCDALDGITARDPAYQIIATFEKLFRKETSSIIAYREFEHFYKNHKAFFTKSAKYTALLTAEAIISAFDKKNKSELQILIKLKLLFSK